MEEQKISQADYGAMVMYAKYLIEKGTITKQEADTTLERIIIENNLNPIYIVA